MKEFKEEGMKEGLPVVKRDNGQMLEQMAKDIQNEITEKESLIKTGDMENSVQRLNNLKKDLELHKKMVETEEVKKVIEKIENEIKTVIKSN